ncbi:MAG TPA: Gfo/Idh/MocA family oxidoreductase [Galbitalea sp.]|jgi:predicted dehydrogenase
MSEPLGVAIVGCGIIGLNHAEAIARHPGLRLVALVDAVPAAARSLADHVDGRGRPRPAEYRSLADALAPIDGSGDATPRPAVDLVVICTPSGLHAALAAEALAAGRHVVIEKPLEVTVPAARELAALAAAAEESGLVASVISQHRYDPASVLVHAAIADGEFGVVTSGVASVAWWRTQEYYDSAGWRGTWALDGGGAVMNQGIHTVDLLLWMLGNPVEVSARTALLAHDGIEVEDTAVATVTFASGALGVIHSTTAAYPGPFARLQVHGSTGSAVIQDDRLEYFHVASRAASDEGNQAWAVVAPEEVHGNPRDADAFVIGHLRQYEDVVAAIREHRQPVMRVEDAYRSMAVVRAMYLSATLGRSVLVAEVLDGSLDAEEVRTGGSR